MLKKIFGYSFLLTIANQLPMLVSLFTLPVVSPYLTRFDYGIYASVFSFIGLFSAFKDWGLTTVLNNVYFKYPQRFKWVWARLLGFIMTWAWVYMLILLVPLYFLLRKDVPNPQYFMMPNGTPNTLYFILFLAVFPLAIFDNTRAIGIRLLQYQHKILPIFLVAITTAVIGAFINIHTITKLHWQGYVSWFVVYFVTSFLNFLYYGWLLHLKAKIYPTLKFNFKWLKRHLKVSIPTIPHFYSTYILKSLDRPLMNMYNIPITDIGLYSVAYNFGNYVESAQMAVNQVLSPIYYRLFAAKKEGTDSLIRLLTFIWQGTTLVGAFIACIWLKEVFAFLYRKNLELSTAYIYSIPIVMSFVYRPMYVAVVDKVIFEEKTKNILLISGGAAVLSILLNLILIPFLGFKAPIITIFFAFMYMGFSGYYWKSLNKHLKVPYFPALWLLVIIVSTVLAFILKDIFYEYKLIITILLLGTYGLVMHKIYPSLQNVLPTSQPNEL